jgi:hypothetical protein
MRRALDELVAAGLVSIGQPGVLARYESWSLLGDDGSESGYRVPSERESDAIQLPASFFFHGWHLVLDPGEIAMLLAIMDMARRVGAPTEPDTQRWVALSRTVRRDYYGLSGEIYLQAQQLREFGLVEFRDPMPARRRGKISDKRTPPPSAPEEREGDVPQATKQGAHPVPYQFSPANPAVFDHDALTVVHDTLSTLSLPYRLDENAALVRPERLVELYRDAKQADRGR